MEMNSHIRRRASMQQTIAHGVIEGVELIRWPQLFPSAILIGARLIVQIVIQSLCVTSG